MFVAVLLISQRLPFNWQLHFAFCFAFCFAVFSSPRMHLLNLLLIFFIIKVSSIGAQMQPNSKPSLLKQSHAVYTLSQAELSRLCCPICEGIVFEPNQCGNCEKVYCGPHVTPEMKCVICKETNWRGIFEIDKYHRHALLSINMRCDCTSELFRYTEYIQHFNQCEKEAFLLGHNYRNFYIMKKGSRVPLSQFENIILNININNQQKEFQYDIFSYDLVKLKRTFFNQEINQSVVNKLEYERHRNHKPFACWCVNLPENHFTPYDNQNQKAVEKAYKEYLKNNEKSKITITVAGQEKVINFQMMIQINPQTEFSRKITREVV